MRSARAARQRAAHVGGRIRCGCGLQFARRAESVFFTACRKAISSVVWLSRCKRTSFMELASSLGCREPCGTTQPFALPLGDTADEIVPCFACVNLLALATALIAPGDRRFAWPSSKWFPRG